MAGSTANTLGDSKAKQQRQNSGAGRLGKVILFLALCAGLYFATFLAAIHRAGQLDATAPADVIITLGAGLRRDGRAGLALSRRSLRAAELWRAGIAPVVICTGGKAEPFRRSEADACREILRAQGLPQASILLEETSRSTEENAIFSSQIMAAHDWTSAVLVSDSYHMLRAGWLFSQQGVEANASPVPASRIRRHSYIRSLLREFLACHWQFIKEALNLPITHLTGL